MLTETQGIHGLLFTAVNKIANKISRSIGILNKLKRCLPQDTLYLLYNSLVLSHLNYGILAWGYQTDKTLQATEKSS